MSRAWSEDEVQRIIEDYFEMFLAEIEAEPYNKAEHRRRLSPVLRDRSHGSIERKHMNISAVLRDLNMPFIDGYKPYSNYQSLLAEKVIGFLIEHPEIEERLQKLTEEQPMQEGLSPIRFESLLVPPPQRRSASAKQQIEIRQSPKGIDYVEMDTRNRRLGHLGEEFILEFERTKLVSAGKGDLANKIEWVAETKGPTMGFDISSFSESGQPIQIEVKTTNHGARFPFKITSNELGTSRRYISSYRLYRLFRFSRNRRLFILSPPLEKRCRLEPKLYQASF